MASHEDRKARRNVEELSSIAVYCAFRVHNELGPGLLESVYEVVLASLLQKEGLNVRRQVPVPIKFENLNFDEGFRADIIVDDLLLIELKSVERSQPFILSKF